MLDWTSIQISPTADGKFVLRWFPVSDRPQTKVFDKLEDVTLFIDENF